MKNLMSHFPDVKAMLFDSGRVLNTSSTGHWFIPPNFFTIVDKENFDSIPSKKRNYAFRSAGKYRDSQKTVMTTEDEYTLFKEFYRLFSDCLPELNLSETQIDAIAKDLVYNEQKYIFYNDAIAVIPLLAQKYKLAIVSDAWPSLRQVFSNANMQKYFSAMIISSELGIAKPNREMYLSAIEALQVKPNEAIFIDDNINNCLGAEKLGINSVLLCRDFKYYIYYKLTLGKKTVINNLHQL